MFPLHFHCVGLSWKRVPLGTELQRSRTKLDWGWCKMVTLPWRMCTFLTRIVFPESTLLVIPTRYSEFRFFRQYFEEKLSLVVTMISYRLLHDAWEATLLRDRPPHQLWERYELANKSWNTVGFHRFIIKKRNILFIMVFISLTKWQLLLV